MSVDERPDGNGPSDGDDASDGDGDGPNDGDGDSPNDGDGDRDGACEAAGVVDTRVGAGVAPPHAATRSKATADDRPRRKRIGLVLVDRRLRQPQRPCVGRGECR
jgi:hypothetical protein